MDPKERQQYITAIKALAEDITLTEADTERIRQKISNRHAELEQAEREEETAALEEELNMLA